MNGDGPAIDLEEAWAVALAITDAWHAGEPADAAAALASHPELAAFRSVVIDLAYQEFLIRENAGAAPDPVQFAGLFPDFSTSVQDMLDAHFLLWSKSGLLKTPMVWPAVGSEFEGLELRSELGRGAFGRAYLGFDSAIGRLRALKVTPGGSAEARVIGGLEHPHVIDVSWARTNESHTAVCMPFVGGCTLADAIESCKGKRVSAEAILDATLAGAQDVPVDKRPKPIVRAADSFLVGACAIGARIAQAVEYLHRMKVVHGDLKPSNVILEPGGSPRLIDFNLAAGDKSNTLVRGTPAYMAAELLDASLAGGNMKGIDGARADIFALGAALIEFLTGTHPFRPTGDNPYLFQPKDPPLAALSARVHKGPSLLPPEIPRPIARLLTSCLAVDPAARPSAAAVAKALDEFVTRERTRKLRQRKRLELMICGAAAVCVVFGISGAIRTDTQPPVPPPVAIQRPPETAAEFFDQGMKLLHDGKHEAARPDFHKAHDLSKDPWALAFAAYCYALRSEHETAWKMARIAADQGAGGPEVENNIGYSLSQKMRHEEAIKQFDAAITASPKLQAAYYNRAMSRFKLMTKKKSAVPDIRAFNDIMKAIEIGPASAELHMDAARIALVFTKQNAESIETAIDQLDAAVKNGQNPATLLNEFGTNLELTNHARFIEISKRKATPESNPSKQLKMLEPIRR